MTDKPKPNFFTVAVSNQRVDLDKKYRNTAGKYRRFLGQLVEDIGMLLTGVPVTKHDQTVVLARIAATGKKLGLGLSVIILPLHYRYPKPGLLRDGHR